MAIKAHIPNFMTLLNLLCGVLAIICVFEFELYQASWLIVIGAILDFGDGLVARMLKVHSELGKQLDSLADVVTFGVAPGLIGFQMLHTAHGMQWFTLFPLMVPLFGGLRLARFNIDTRQSDSFIGLPIPANALFWLALPMIVYYQNSTASLFDPALITHPAVIVSASVVLSFLMISELKLMALKFRAFGWSSNQFRYIFILLSGLLLIFFFFAAIPIILLLYVIISLIQNFPKK